MKPCDPSVTFRQFSFATTNDLLDDVAEAMLNAAQSPHAEAVHKLRVSIRRFQQSLRLFRQFLAKRGLKQVRRELKSIMEPAGELRNFDIAIGLVRRARGDVASLKARRVTARTALMEALSESTQASPADRWRDALELPPK